jgi:autotransporter-associated beta strand protein
MELVLGGGSFDTGVNNITVEGGISGDRSLSKKGAGILTLNGDLSYTGSTTVAAGKLVVNGALTHSPDVTVANGAQLFAASIVADSLTIGGSNNSSAQAVPEPSAMVLAILGGLGLMTFLLRRRK